MSVLYITEQGSRLRRRGGRYVVEAKGDELASIPQATLERVVIYGNIQVTTPAMTRLLEDGVEVLLLSRAGRFQGMLQPGYSKNVYVRLAQYERSLDADYVLSTVRNIVVSRIESLEVTFRRWRRNGWLADSTERPKFAAMVKAAASAEEATQVRGLEAWAARSWFGVLADALPGGFEWQGRNRRPPRDPVNALLSLTYMMLLGELVSACYIHGLDPNVGFLHELDYSRPSLALDLIERVRAPLADSLVVRELRSGRYTADDFAEGETLGCRLTPDAFRRWCQTYRDWFGARRANGQTPRRWIHGLAVETAKAVQSGIPPTFERLTDPWRDCDAPIDRL